ncbi:MAG: SpoIID/LytB domain-containing protein, partial [Candidatus Eremiobacteraeota bacterium]|nr:SpoIID/LytB domain-containing protein [Candidatus Eremiobacteraeota bacterium]
MRRRTFMHLSGATLIFALPGRAFGRDPESDPSNGSDQSSLRVLLGRGNAQRIDDQTFTYNGRRYRGRFDYSETHEVISTVPVEQYLYSVVSREMPRSWPDAALQAQAIAARTYVLQRSNPKRNYDVVTSESDQVYTGMDAESASTTAAVDASAGKVLRFNNAFATIAYSSCCGGHTEAAADAWSGGSKAAYLQGVRCPHCTDSPWYRWSTSIALDRVNSALGDRIGSLGGIDTIEIGDRDPSGRARVVNIQGPSGETHVNAADFRRALGTRDIPSVLLHSITIEEDDQGVRKVK